MTKVAASKESVKQSALINQRKAFYPEFKSMTIDIVGINQWNKSLIPYPAHIFVMKMSAFLRLLHICKCTLD